jgi:DNA-binding GntR family transcriptional regulator
MRYASTLGHVVSTALPPTPGARFLNGTTGAIPSRTEAVLEAVKHAILAGELRPGQSLVETELSQLLGVSKTPVREALKTLAGAGLVTMSPYRGATVRAIDASTAAAIYDLRLLVEPEAVGRAVRAAAAAPAGPAAPAASTDPTDPPDPTGPAGPDPWAQATAALQASAAAQDQAQRSLANRDFHRALYLGCGNSLIVKVLDDLRDQTALVSALSWQQAPSWEHEAAQHRAILAAAQAGDADRAAGLLREHIAGFAARHFAASATPATPATPAAPATSAAPATTPSHR